MLDNLSLYIGLPPTWLARWDQIPASLIRGDYGSNLNGLGYYTTLWRHPTPIPRLRWAHRLPASHRLSNLLAFIPGEGRQPWNTKSPTANPTGARSLARARSSSTLTECGVGARQWRKAAGVEQLDGAVPGVWSSSTTWCTAGDYWRRALLLSSFVFTLLDLSRVRLGRERIGRPNFIRQLLVCTNFEGFQLVW